MSDSLARELAALRQAVETLPREDRPGPVIGSIGGDGAVGTDVGSTERWADLDAHGVSFSGLRALMVGGDAAVDAAAARDRGAGSAETCVDTVELAGLDPRADGAFDVVHCAELLHRVTEPMTLLAQLRRLTASDGTLLISSAMLADPERSEYLRFVPTHYAGDSSWWFVPGRLALRWLLHCTGFEVHEEFGERECPRDGFPVVSGYLRATPITPPASG